MTCIALMMHSMTSCIDLAMLLLNLQAHMSLQDRAKKNVIDAAVVQDPYYCCVNQGAKTSSILAANIVVFADSHAFLSASVNKPNRGDNDQCTVSVLQIT